MEFGKIPVDYNKRRVINIPSPLPKNLLFNVKIAYSSEWFVDEKMQINENFSLREMIHKLF